MPTKKDRLQAAIWLSNMMQSRVGSGEEIKMMLNKTGGILEIFSCHPKALMKIFSKEQRRSNLEFYVNSATRRGDALKDANITLNHYKDIQMEVISFNEKQYPFLLKQISSAPPILYYLSKPGIDILQRFGVGIVGTRNPTSYGRNITKKLVSGFAKEKIVIISGMARGIDSVAHQAAIENKILTAAVVGSGLDIIYPPENNTLMKKIIDKGIVISEYPPGTPPSKNSFPARNRIISGLSKCIIVTEAAKKSGTMITAGFAADQGRDVFAVPGSVFSPNSIGTNLLIKDGAQIILSADDIIDNYTYNNWFNKT